MLTLHGAPAPDPLWGDRMEMIDLSGMRADLERGIEDALAGYSLDREGEDNEVAVMAAKVVMQWLLEEGFIGREE